MISDELYYKLPDDLKEVYISVQRQKAVVSRQKTVLKVAEDELRELKGKCPHTVSAFRHGYCDICESILDIRP